ncbi:MAG: oligosaccharide flippase family protein, partial [Promethearchaeota archaeon]
SIGQASSMVFHFVSIMILTRALSKVDFGVYALILVINNLFLILSGLGLDVTLVKYISSNKKEERSSVFTKILYTKILSLSFFTTLFIFTGNLFLPFFSEKIIDYIFFIPILFFLGSFRDLFFKVLQGLNYFKKYAATQIVSAMTRFLLIAYIYLQGNLNLNTLILVEILTVIVVLLTELKLVPFKLLVDKKVKKMNIKSIMNFAFPIYVNNIFGFMYSRINLVIIGALLMPVSVAYYDVGAKIPQALKKMFSSFILVFFPNLSKLFSAGQKSSGEKLVNKSLNAISILLSIAVLISFLFRSEIITLVFSERYADSSLVFALLMLNFTLVALANILGYTNLSAGYPKVPMKVNIICSFIGIGGSLLLIPQIGYVGAAYSLIVMNIVAQLLYLFYLRRVNIVINLLQYTMPIILLIITVGLYSLLSNDSFNVRLLTVFIFLVLNWFFVTEFKSLFNSIIKIVPKFKS